MKIKSIIITIFISQIFLSNCFLKNNNQYKSWYKKYNIQSEDELSEISALPILIQALDDEDDHIKLLSMNYIRRLGPNAKKAGPKISKLLLTSKNEEIQIWATRSIGSIIYDDSEIIKVIAKNLLMHNNVFVRKFSAVALGELENSSEMVLSALNHASTNDKDGSVQDMARRSSKKLLSLSIVDSKSNVAKSIKEKQNVVAKNLLIGITDLDAINVSSDLSSALTNRLHNELFESGYFVILERQKMAEILKEQGFQLSGCTSNECAIEIGRLLNVKQMLAGSILSVGKIYSLSLRLIDVETGKIVSSSIIDIQGDIEKLLTEGLKESVNKLNENME